jgi:hypothetical protein
MMNGRSPVFASKSVSLVYPCPAQKPCDHGKSIASSRAGVCNLAETLHPFPNWKPGFFVAIISNKSLGRPFENIRVHDITGNDRVFEDAVSSSTYSVAVTGRVTVPATSTGLEEFLVHKEFLPRFRSTPMSEASAFH